MTRRLTWNLLAGMLTLAIMLAAVIGVRSYLLREADYLHLGCQNALLGSRITQYVLEKAIDNGLLDRKMLFDGHYERVDNRGSAHYRTDYDHFFDRSVMKILKAFEADDDISYAYVVNNDGYIPAHTDLRKSKTKSNLPAIGIPPADPRSSPRNQIVTRDDGNEYREFHAPICVYGQSWGEFCVGIPVALANNRGLEMAVGTFVITILFSLVVVGVMVGLIRFSLWPLRELTRATRQMAAGNVAVRCRYARRDELGVLSQSFNTMAETISQTQEDLERQVQERTAQLASANEGMLMEIAERKRAEEALRLAKDSAETANRTKSEFLANMSHEIRTPMTAILGYADILADSVAVPEQQEAVRTIKRNSNHLLGLVNDILDLSKIEAGRLQMECLHTSPLAIFADVVSLMRVRAEAKALPLKLEYLGPIPQRIQVDPTRLRQILVNLVGNAIKFTETGEVKINVCLIDRNTTTPKLQCEVIDTGVGIGPEQLERLFQPFQQADASTTRKFGGTGLGLAISKRLAVMLGGDITVSGVLGEGSCFTLTVATGSLEGITMLEQPAEAMARITVEPETVAAPPLALLNRRILLAEDGPDNQRLIAFVLRKAGAEVHICDNGQKAMEKGLSTVPGWGRRHDDCKVPFDVILMDMQMPVMDGYEATRRLRQHGYKGPILALTAHAMKDDMQKCLDAGCDAYLTKPIVREQFLSTVACYLKSPTPADKPGAAKQIPSGQ